MSDKNLNTWCVSKHKFVAGNEDELSFDIGQKIRVVQQPEGGWWEGTLDGRSGWFPANHVASTVDVEDCDECPAITKISSISDLWKNLTITEKKLVQKMESFWGSFLKPLQNVSWLPQQKRALLTNDYAKAMAVHKEFLHGLVAETTTMEPNVMENVMCKWLPCLGLCATGCAATAAACVAMCECESLEKDTVERREMSAYTTQNATSLEAFHWPVQRIAEYVQYIERLKSLAWTHDASMIDDVARFHDAIVAVQDTVARIDTRAAELAASTKVVVTSDVCVGAPFLPPAHKSGGLTTLASFGELILQNGPMCVHVAANTLSAGHNVDGTGLTGLDAAAVMLFTGRLVVFTTQFQPREGEAEDVATGNILYECALVVPLVNADVFVDEKHNTIIHVAGAGAPACALTFESTNQSGLWASELYDQTVDSACQLETTTAERAALDMIRPLGLGRIYRARYDEDRADAALSAEGKRSGPGRRWRFRRAGDGSQRGNAALPLPKRMGQNRAMSLDRSTEAARTSVLKAQTTGDTSERLSEYRMISTYGTSTA
eukprot:m.1144312 g.1144312  ORF g.1144312 m.1144312 type:complete len:548 (+) comp24462_c0_seq17:446-2089(+)